MLLNLLFFLQLIFYYGEGAQPRMQKWWERHSSSPSPAHGTIFPTAVGPRILVKMQEALTIIPNNPSLKSLLPFPETLLNLLAWRS